MLRIFAFLFIFIKSTKSVNIQDVSCDLKFSDRTCYVDGNCLQNSSAHLNIIELPTYLYKLHLENFEYLMSNQFVESIKVKEFCISNSTFEVVERSDAKKLKVQYFYIVNSTLVLKSNGFSSFKNIDTIQFENVKFEEIETAAFASLPAVSYFGFTDVKMSKNLINSLKTLNITNIFSCTRCEITEEIFSDILHNIKLGDSLQVTSNFIKFIKCDEIARLELFMLTIDLNQLFGIFPTCGVQVVDLSNNRVETIFIQSGTTTIDASRNLISDIKCDNFVNLIVINLKSNFLSDLMCLARISTLEELNIDSNNFTIFKKKSFEKLTKLKIISVLNNQINFIHPGIFASVKQNVIKRISVDRFDFGYKDLTKFYPNLYEVFHNKTNKSSKDYDKISEALKSQNISLYLLE